MAFLQRKGLSREDITLSAPSINDKLANQYGNAQGMQFRYTATQEVTVYSEQIDTVHQVMATLSDLGKNGIVLTGGYSAQPEYIFTRLNDVKPDMVEEATTQARAVADKFAQDSNSALGKIKRASQGQFSIYPRDRNNPHIKKVRVVSTVTYYLVD